METLTHWKKVMNPKYLGSWSLQPGTEMIATIKEIKPEVIVGEGGKKDGRNVAYFYETLKPMVLNATNSKTITKLAGSAAIEKWPGLKIQIYVTIIQDKVTKEDIETLRIRDVAPREQVDNSAAIATIQGCMTLADLQTTYTGLPKSASHDPLVIAAKDKRKGELANAN